MKYTKIETIRDEVVGVIPVDSEQGIFVKILNTDGEWYTDSRQMRSVIKALGRTYGVDIPTQATMISGITGKRSLNPFFLTPERVFIPLKVLKPIRHDPAYAYVDVDYIEDIVEDKENKQCSVCLKNGVEIIVFSSRSAVLQNIHNGEIVKRLSTGNEEPQRLTEDILLVESTANIGRVLCAIKHQLNEIQSKL